MLQSTLGRRMHRYLLIFTLTFALTFTLLVLLSSLLILNKNDPWDWDNPNSNKIRFEFEPTTTSSTHHYYYYYNSLSPPMPQLERPSARVSNFKRYLLENLRGRLLDLRNFTYTINTINRCANKQSLVIMVHSAVDHFTYRNVIRKTWARATQHAQPYFPVTYVFVLAQTSHNFTVARKVQEESNLYGDIIEANFEDSYRNLTYKHLASLRWVVQYCSHAQFVLKVDDDAYLDLYAVISTLRMLGPTKRHFLACTLFPPGSEPKRSGKWGVSHDLYPYPTYPKYCSGVGYLTTPSVAFDLYVTAHRVPFRPIPIDDVYVTGLVAGSLANLRPKPLNGLFVYDVQRLRSWAEETPLKCPSGAWIGDIGYESDWQSLALLLWNRTETVWNLKSNSFQNCKLKNKLGAIRMKQRTSI